MHHIVKQVANKEPDKKRRNQRTAQDGIEEKIKQGSEGYADRRNHYQSFAVTRVIVMNTVKYKMDASSQLTGQLPMKEKPVQHVFGKCPDKEACSYQQRNHSGPEMEYEHRLMEEINNYRQKDNERYSKMHPRKGLEKVTLEHPRTFVFVGNKILCHAC